MYYFKVAPLLTLTAVACASLASPAQALFAARPMPPEAFLAYPADTVPALTTEVTDDRAVQARLARHFHLSGPAMCAYVRDNLILKKLDAPRQVRVSYLDTRAQEYSVPVTLPVGTPVFASRDTGQPVLLTAGGNPLVVATIPVHSAGGAGAAAGLLASGIGVVALIPHSGGSSSGGGSSSTSGVSSSTSVASPSSTGQVLFTRHSEAVPLPVGDSRIGQADVLTVAAPGDLPPNGEVASALLPTALPTALPGDGVPASVPEPGSAMTFAVATLLLAGLRLRRRVS